MWFQQRQLISGKYLIHKKEVCTVLEVHPSIDIWYGEWITGLKKKQTFYHCISQTKTKDWTKLVYEGLTRFEITHPFCKTCGNFLNLAYPGPLKDPPVRGWFCTSCF